MEEKKKRVSCSWCWEDEKYKLGVRGNQKGRAENFPSQLLWRGVRHQLPWRG